MKPSQYRIQENAAYKLSRHELNHHRHTQHHGHDAQHRATDATFRAAHVVQLIGILMPVAVSHFIKEPENQWRAMRLASLITAVLTGGIWEAHHYQNKREKEHCDWISRVCDELGKDGTQFTPPR